MLTLAKFHLTLSNMLSLPPLRYLYTGCVRGPFTSTFSKIGNVTPLLSANARISEGDPGS
jgi:hypothetical protein